ncbi:sugar isomerase domain-containing protein [bacterium]|nr:sugar isomerase domain-containing protein [bacterium]
MFIERVEGLAEVILSNFVFQANDIMIIFSSSGTTAVPIEMAMGAKSRGLPIVAVTAVSHSLAGPSGHPSGTRLLDHADVVIDISIPIGDAAISLDGVETPVGPVSTVANAAVVNEIKVQAAELLAARDALPAVITSASVIGAARSAELFDEAYWDHARRLAAALGGTGK